MAHHAVTVVVVDREPGMARYFVYDAQGIEIKQVHRNVTAELARAVKQHKTLTQILEEAEGA